MSLTEQELRDSLRRATEAPPHVTDRVGAVERRVRRRRTRIVVGTAIAVVVALAAVPVARWLPDRLSRNDIASSDITPQQMDAMMKYASFVAYWSGTAYGLKRPDTGVVGVTVTTSLPPFNCALAVPEEGQPQGTQKAWLVAAPSVVQGTRTPGPTAGVITSYLLWPVGATNCESGAPGTVLAEGPDSAAHDLLSWTMAYGQLPDDPSRPALDVAGVFHEIPADRVTDFGRGVFESYESSMPKEFGPAVAQLDRVLVAVGGWLSVALSYDTLNQTSPVDGPTTLTADIEKGGDVTGAGPDNRYIGTAQLPAGYHATWERGTGKFCVEGSVGDSGVRHVSQDAFADPGSEPLVTVVDGPCP